LQLLRSSAFISKLTDRLPNTRERVILEVPSTLSRRNLNSMVRPNVHTYPEKLSTENENALQTGVNLKTPAFRVDGKHFENGAFRKR